MNLGTLPSDGFAEDKKKYERVSLLNYDII